MLGDVADITGRLRAVLPSRWFSDASPNLNGLLQSIATPWSWFYSLVQYVRQQARVATASDSWLDLIALDFFGSSLVRKVEETDDAFRTRVQWSLTRSSATRAALRANLHYLTRTYPVIFEPANTSDTGAYASGRALKQVAYAGMSYGFTGGWGSLELPYQVFVTAKRPQLEGVASVTGYGSGPGGYGAGSAAYVDLALLSGSVTDQDIATCVCDALPINTTAWLRID